MAEVSEAARTLGDLMEVCRAAEQGFRAAALGIADPTLRRLFESYAEQRAAFAGELGREIVRLGKKPSRARAGMAAPGTLSARPEPAILSEREASEEAVVRAYRAAAERQLPRSAGEAIERQYLLVRDACDHVRLLEGAYASV